MKRLRLIYHYRKRLQSGEYLPHKTDEGMLMEVSCNDRVYTFARKAIVIGSYLVPLEFAEAQAQQLAFENLKTQCPECRLEPFHMVAKDGRLLHVQCACRQQTKRPA